MNFVSLKTPSFDLKNIVAESTASAGDQNRIFPTFPLDLLAKN
jgi:hypothetical protein